MVKINKKDNQLNILKRGNVLKLIKKEGITRISPQALEALDKRISEDIKSLVKKLKQHLQINAKKTLEKQDIIEYNKPKE